MAQPRTLAQSLLGPDVGGFFGSLAANPTFMAGFSGLAGRGHQPGMQIAEAAQKQDQRQRMEQVWGNAFPSGQPNFEHPLLKGLNPDLAAQFGAMGWEQGLPALQKYALTRATPPELQLKEINNQGVVFNPRSGSTQVLPGLAGGGGSGKAPPGYRWSADGNLEAIPGGPATSISAEAGGRLAMMETAMPAVQQARDVFLKPWGITGAIGQAVMPEQLSNWSGEVGRAKRSVRAAIEAALRVMTGAAAPEPEVVRYLDIFMPTMTDTRETAKQKLDLLEAFMLNAREIATRGRRQDGAASPAASGQQNKRVHYNPSTGELE